MNDSSIPPHTNTHNDDGADTSADLDKILAIEKEKTRRQELKAGVLPDTGGEPRQLIGRSMAEVQMRAIDWLWTGWIPRKYITLIVGESGAGKSTVLADIVARITTGSPWPGSTEQRPPSRVLWLGSEDGAEDMTKPRLMACGANPDRVIEIQGVKQGEGRATFSMQDDVGAVKYWLEFARKENDPFVMLVIDPITSYLPGRRLRKVDMNDTGQLRSILEPWFEVAQTYNLAIASVTHFNKDTTRSMLHRVTGSAVFAQTCRSLCAMVAREDDGPFERAMVQVKVNLPEHPGGAWRFRTEKICLGEDPMNHNPINATRPAWDSLDTAITPSSLMGGQRGPISDTPTSFGLWVRAHFMSTDPAHGGLRCEDVLATALSQKVCSKRWWNEHSGEFLEKKNVGGIYWCRPWKHLTQVETT
jgi:hypothetical protein